MNFMQIIIAIYIQATKELINEYGNEQVSVYSTDMENYLGSLQSFGFLYRGNLDGEFWFLQSGFLSHR